MGWLPLRFGGLVAAEDKPTEFLCSFGVWGEEGGEGIFMKSCAYPIHLLL